MPSTPTMALSDLLLAVRQYPAGSLEWQKLVTQIIRHMQRSGTIWRDYRISTDQYQEALQRTWLWFCQNLHNYDQTQSSITTWFNYILKYRIKDVMRESQINQNQHIFLHHDETFNIISNLPAPTTNDSLQLLTKTLAWLHQERPQLEQMTIRDRPDITAYTLISHRLPTSHQASWKELSAQFEVAIPTLSSFYRRQCLPLLREFGTSQGWVDQSAPGILGKKGRLPATLSAGVMTKPIRSPGNAH